MDMEGTYMSHMNYVFVERTYVSGFGSRRGPTSRSNPISLSILDQQVAQPLGEKGGLHVIESRRDMDRWFHKDILGV